MKNAKSAGTEKLSSGQFKRVQATKPKQNFSDVLNVRILGENIDKLILMKIEVRKSKLHDRGIFATQDINEGEIIEKCPVLLFPIKDEEHLNKSHLYNYYFEWDKDSSSMVLGYGMIYNHSHEPNAEFHIDYENKVFILKAIKKIKIGEEITHNYNGDPDDKTKVWFHDYV